MDTPPLHNIYAAPEFSAQFPMPQFVVSARKVNWYWPATDLDRIYEARQLYDSGLIEMATGRTQTHFILYAFPRRKQAARRAWFTRQDFV